MRTTLSRLCKSDDGATAVEYGIIAAMIAVAAVAAFRLAGTNLAAVFNTAASFL